MFKASINTAPLLTFSGILVIYLTLEYCLSLCLILFVETSELLNGVRWSKFEMAVCYR